MEIDEIMYNAREFICDEVKFAYTVIACANEWQKETGGTLDELLAWMDSHMPKKQAMVDFLNEIVTKRKTGER